MTDLGCRLSNVGDWVALWLCCSPTTRMPEPYPEPYSHAVPFGKGGDPPKKLLHHQYGGVTEKGKPNHYAWIVDNESVDASVCRRRKLKPKVAYTGDNPTNVREAPTQIPHTRPGYQPLHTHTCMYTQPPFVVRVLGQVYVLDPKPDGCCMFASLAYAAGRESAKSVRDIVASHVEDYPEMYRFVCPSFGGRSSGLVLSVSPARLTNPCCEHPQCVSPAATRRRGVDLQRLQLLEQR